MITKIAYKMYQLLQICGHCGGGGHCGNISMKKKNIKKSA